MKMFFSQSDSKWRRVQRYHERSADTLQQLDEAVVECIKHPKNSRKKDLARVAYSKFGEGIEDLIANGLPDSEQGYSIDDYGCWDCTIAMIVAELGCKFYEYGKAKTGLEANPKNLVKVLRSWQILSPIAFSYDIYTDPVSIVTNGDIQLLLHEDYGESGEYISKATVLMYALAKLKDLSGQLGIAICIDGHPTFGKKRDTHWVFVDPSSSEKNIMLGDPSEKENTGPTKIESRKIYEVCVYTTQSGVKSILSLG